MTGPIVITGMHRSGTSLLARVLCSAGVHLGDRLLPPGPANPHGYFEDLDFIELHDDLLAARGTTWHLRRAPRGPVPIELRARAEALVTARRHRAAWGWKDPRTSLHLEMWAEIAPDAHFVLVYRPPEGVLDSLRRRGDAAFRLGFPGAVVLGRLGFPRFRTALALRVWMAYNRRIADFAGARPEQCTVLRHDELPERVSALLDRLRSAGRELGRPDVAALVDPSLGRPPADSSLTRRCRRDAAVVALLERLDALAD